MTENLGSPADGSWVTEAIAEQEEYIKRMHSCLEQLGRPHRFETIRPYRLLGTGVSVPDNETWRQCLNCGVTETSEDYARKLAAGPTPPAPEDPEAVPAMPDVAIPLTERGTVGYLSAGDAAVLARVLDDSEE